MADLLTRSPEIQEIIDLFERGDVDAFQKKGGLEGFAKQFNTDLIKGIDDSESNDNYSSRIEKYGKNQLPDPEQKTWCKLFLECYQDLLLRILLIAAVVSIILTSALTPKKDLSFEDYIDTISIFVAILIVSIVQAQTNYQQQKSFLEINKLKNSFPVTVIRGGEKIQIDSTEVLVGDLLEVKTGDCVAADAFYVEGANLTINNSAQTGESIAVKIDSSNMFCRGGGAIESGNAVLLVAAVGVNSQAGVTMMQIHAIEQEATKSPLETKLDRLGSQITWFGMGAAIGTFIILLIFWSIKVDKARKEKTFGSHLWTDLLDSIMIGVTIFICAVPEGLPLAVTLSLSFSMKKMMKDNNFVRNLNACETMGGATTICSDKTGTLTQNKMTVVKFLNANGEQNGNPELSNEFNKLLGEAISVNSSASKVLNDGKITYVGSSSECALIQMIEDRGFDFEKIRQSLRNIKTHEFNSARKRMSTVVSNEEGKKFAFLKGAPDFCIPRCKRFLNNDMTVSEINEEFQQKLVDGIKSFAQKSLRTMLIAYREVNDDEDIANPDVVEDNMIFICIVGIQDPLRPEVIRAVQLCKTAGVVVRMVTGDYIDTARAISTECGIIENDTDIVMEGKDFAKMSKLELLEKIDNLRVLARSSPTDKYRLVSFLMECGEVVAVTGDGSNDSAALKKANVGLSMGVCGTELAKVASDIVILDDNFNSIVNALKWGRCIYDNVKSFLSFQLTVNVSACIISVVGSIALKNSPLRTIQLLWVNLIMDSLGALALATRSPTDQLLYRQPYGEGDNIISKVVLRNIIGQVTYQMFSLLLILFGHDKLFGIEDNTEKKDLIGMIIFNTFVFQQVFNLINARSASNDTNPYSGIFDNVYFVVIFLLIAIVQVLIITVIRGPFGTHNIGWKGWVITIVASVLTLPVGFLIRLIPIQDRVSESLDKYRKMKRDAVRQRYQGMDSENQWKVEVQPDQEEEKMNVNEKVEVENDQINDNQIEDDLIDNQDLIP